MAGPSRRSFSDWEREAARACAICGRRVLNKDASTSLYDHRTGRALVWHADCKAR